MIFTALNAVVAYRMHTPKWAMSPMSGAGAAAHGGRLNRVGLEALYLALETETAIKEYQQVSTLLPPGTLVSYQVSAAKVADFRVGFDAAHWSEIWNDFFCDWRALWFNERIEPPSWVIADEAIAQGAQGILFASAIAPGGSNLVLFPSMLTASDAIRVFDPAAALPKNQDSWT
jgi:RES domain-containing protein